jgi:hypothetical protein
MPSKLIILATVSGLALTSAWAQSPAPTAPAKPAPAAPSMAQPAATKASFVHRQSPDQWVMSKFKGTDVVGQNNEAIGDVNDVLFDKNGTVAAFVIGVGGFLGIGAKDVAIAPASFQVIKDNGEDKLKIAMTKDELKQAPAFEYYNAPARGATNTNMQRPRPAPATQ